MVKTQGELHDGIYSRIINWRSICPGRINQIYRRTEKSITAYLALIGCSWRCFLSISRGFIGRYFDGHQQQITSLVYFHNKPKSKT